MRNIISKEFNGFFSSAIGYLVVVVFLLITGLFVWVFQETSLFTYGYATLDNYFELAPWVFLFLIPAVTMRSFSDEFRTGTFESLVTKPLHLYEIIVGKYLGALLLICIALLPTLLYFSSVYYLGAEIGNIDRGATIGSYIGLVLLSACFCAIGIFSSALTSNQIVAFILAVSLCFLFYIAFDYFSKLPVFYASYDRIVELLGIRSHYESISRGVVDSRDITYFVTVILLFLGLTHIVIERKK